MVTQHLHYSRTTAITVSTSEPIELRSHNMLTFQHLHGHSEWLVGLLLIDADGLGHDHLTKAALAQRLPQS